MNKVKFSIAARALAMGVVAALMIASLADMSAAKPLSFIVTDSGNYVSWITEYVEYVTVQNTDTVGGNFSVTITAITTEGNYTKQSENRYILSQNLYKFLIIFPGRHIDSYFVVNAPSKEVTTTPTPTPTITQIVTPLPSPTSTTGTIKIYSTPSGASIYLDGVYIGTTPSLLTDVSQGSHEVKLTLSGYNDWSNSLISTSGTSYILNAELITVTPTFTPLATPTAKTPEIQTPSASVQLHGEKTDVLIGEDIIFKLSAVNKITKPVMAVQVILIPPSGMSVTSSEFATSGAGQYTTTYKLDPGAGKDIEVRIKTNQQGDFNVKGEIVYYYGDDKSTAEDQMLNLPIKVREISKTPTTPTTTPQSPTLSFWVSLLIFGISYRLIKRDFNR